MAAGAALSLVRGPLSSPHHLGTEGCLAVLETLLDEATREVVTHKGRSPTPDTLRRFLVGPRGCEITGIAETPDGRALFVNIQHPGEETEDPELAGCSLITAKYSGRRGTRGALGVIGMARQW